MDEQIHFEGEGAQYAPPLQSREYSAITGIVIKWGLAKDERSAGLVLLGVAIVAVIIALWLMLGGSGGGSGINPSNPAQLERMQRQAIPAVPGGAPQMSH